jgi:hypothetical protein
MYSVPDDEWARAAKTPCPNCSDWSVSDISAPPTLTKDKTMTPLTPAQKHEQRLQMQRQGINAAASQDKIMTHEERAERKANHFFEAATAKHNALKAAGGLASDKTLRDEFAGLALAGLAQDESVTAERAGEIAYEMADAMLEARKTPEGDKT